MKRIGLISLALVLALGALGVGYAAWTDHVTIEGTVDTGSLSIGFLSPRTHVVWDQTGPKKDGEHIATVEIDFEGEIGVKDFLGLGDQTAYEKLLVTIDGAFPQWETDIAFYIGSMGTIPLHLVDFDIYDPDGVLEFFWVSDPSSGAWSGYFYAVDPADPENWILTVTVGGINEGDQIHFCDWDKGDLIIELHQPAEQKHTYRFVVEINAIQWNKDE